MQYIYVHNCPTNEKSAKVLRKYRKAQRFQGEAEKK